jgi:hypothetical protein
MSKNSHKVIVRYAFSDGSTSNVTKFATSMEDGSAKIPAIVARLLGLGHSIVSIEVVEMKRSKTGA